MQFVFNGKLKSSSTEDDAVKKLLFLIDTQHLKEGGSGIRILYTA
jgi:hypothetical protein